MLNKFPFWKNLTIILVALFAFVYAAPNYFPADAAIQLSGQSGSMKIDNDVLKEMQSALDDADIDYFGGKTDDQTELLRIKDRDSQLRAKEIIQAEMGSDYIVALNLAPTTPRWLRSLGGKPMKLGLDLSGGVHFLLEVDLESALVLRLEGTLSDIKALLREERVRYRSFELLGNQIVGRFRDDDQAHKS